MVSPFQPSRRKASLVGSSFEFMAGNKVVLEQEDTVTVVSDTASSLDVALTIMEQT